MTKTETIMLVGCGKMGGALMDGWIGQGTPPESIFAVDPMAPELPAGVSGGAAFDDIPEGFAPSVVVLAVKPQVMDEVLAPYVALVGPGTVFLSIAAGRTIASFEAVLGAEARVVRAMPNTPAAVGRGITVLDSNLYLSRGDISLKSISMSLPSLQPDTLLFITSLTISPQRAAQA